MSSLKRSLIQLHVFVFLAGLTAPLGNLIQLNGLYIVFYRILLTVLALSPIYLLHQQPNKVSLKEKGWLMFIGVLISIHWVCFYGAIKMAKHLNLGPDDNVVTIATDGFDRYDSVIQDLERRYLETEDFVLDRWFNDVFRKIGTEDIVDYRTVEQKEKLFKRKEADWLKFGYKQEYLDAMRNPEFWDSEYNKVFSYDEAIKKLRGEHK